MSRSLNTFGYLVIYPAIHSDSFYFKCILLVTSFTITMRFKTFLEIYMWLLDKSWTIRF
uniref:Uncharacterized protein n=1 Tax=Lepeophtheirus salmonis TaxID=72036 RepID=A0A0K2UMH1_LEPSM